MSHRIHGIVGRRYVLEPIQEILPAAIIVPLESGFAWIPIFDKLLEAAAESTSLEASPHDERFVDLGGVLPALLALATQHGPVAYVETKYFGGSGRQIATVFDHGRRTLQACSVNQALAAIGVTAAAGRDEWDTVGLSSHRRLPDAAFDALRRRSRTSEVVRTTAVEDVIRRRNVRG